MRRPTQYGAHLGFLILEMLLMVQVQKKKIDFRGLFCGEKLSDSPESFRKEAGILFPEFSLIEWAEKEEPEFRNERVVFDEENFVHRINKCT